MEQDKHGDWVELTEYEALQVEAERLQQRIDELEGQLEEYEEYAEQRYEEGYQMGLSVNEG